MKFLVTGGAGFIGSHIVEELVRRKQKVRILDNFSTGKRENLKGLKASIKLIEGDIRDNAVVRRAVNGIDVILHQAAVPSVARSVADPVTTMEVNVMGTLNLLQAAQQMRVKRFVFASSSSIYGNQARLPLDEKMQTDPLSPYAVSKLAGEKLVHVFSRLYGLRGVCLRYFNVFGPRQDPHSQYSAVIPLFLKAMSKEKAPTIFGDGKQSRDFTYVQNVVSANLLAASADIKTSISLNCACHNRISLLQIINKINKLLNTSIKPVFKGSRAGDIRHSFASIKLIQKNLNFTPRFSFDDGLTRTLQWYQLNDKPKKSSQLSAIGSG